MSEEEASPLWDSVLTGPIRVNEVLQRVFAFLQADLRTLLSVAATCRAWRERCSALPQWGPIGAGSSLSAYREACRAAWDE